MSAIRRLRRYLTPLLIMAASTSRDESYAHALSTLAMSGGGGGGLSTRTVVVGLNAAFQKRFVLPPTATLIPGSVHRASAVEEGLGGKGQDVAVSLSQLWPDGGDGRRRPLALAQFVGSGPGGDAVMGLLSDALGAASAGGWDALTVRCRSAMRTCTTIVGSDASTELVEPSGVIEEDEMEGLMGRIDALAASGGGGGGGGAAALCVMGSMPPGCPDGTYADLCAAVAGDRTVTVVDTVVGLGPLLGTMAAKRGEAGDAYGGGTVLKVNAAELCRLAAVERSGGGEAEGATPEELAEAVDGFLRTHCDGPAEGALDYMAITDGRHPAHLVRVGRDGAESRLIRMDVADLSGEGSVLYPIGAGDTVAAGTLAAWLNLREGGTTLSPMAEATHEALLKWRDGIDYGDDDDALPNILTSFAFGLACGSASCLKQENSVFDMNDALRLFNQMSKPSI